MKSRTSTFCLGAATLILGLLVASQAVAARRPLPTSCATVPTISTITVNQSVIPAKNNKPVSIVFSGNISSAEGCTQGDAWYRISDEYGELDGTTPLSLDADGNFSVSVNVIASRKGDDKDGRLYTVVFGAKNDAGEVEGGETSVVVSHDNGK